VHRTAVEQQYSIPVAEYLEQRKARAPAPDVDRVEPVAVGPVA